MHPLTEIIANNPDAYPRVIYILTNGSVVARNVFTVDWGFPAMMGKRLRIVDDLSFNRMFRGAQPEFKAPLDDVVWKGPSALRLQHYWEIAEHARLRGFRLLNWYEHPNYHCPNHPEFSLRRDVTKNYA